MFLQIYCILVYFIWQVLFLALTTNGPTFSRSRARPELLHTHRYRYYILLDFFLWLLELYKGKNIRELDVHWHHRMEIHALSFKSTTHFLFSKSSPRWNIIPNKSCECTSIVSMHWPMTSSILQSVNFVLTTFIAFDCFFWHHSQILPFV